jgi:DivIVA domain-containing protein
MALPGVRHAADHAEQRCVMSAGNRHGGSTGETPEQTLARLNAGSRIGESPGASRQGGLRFPVVRFREGYDICEVDAFIDTIDQRTADEVRGVRFSTTQLKAGYDEDEVDQFLDEQAARLADRVIPEPPPPTDPGPQGRRAFFRRRWVQVAWQVALVVLALAYIGAGFWRGP